MIIAFTGCRVNTTPRRENVNFLCYFRSLWRNFPTGGGAVLQSRRRFAMLKKTREVRRMMQAWTPEGMAFLQDAMACCGYYPALARRIAPYLPKQAHVLSLIHI